MLDQIIGAVVAFLGIVVTIAFIQIMKWYWKDYRSIVMLLLLSWFVFMGGLLFLAGIAMVIGPTK
jgi:hypothetical protein